VVKVDWRGLVLVVVVGVCVGMFTGAVENRPSKFGISEDKVLWLSIAVAGYSHWFA